MSTSTPTTTQTITPTIQDSDSRSYLRRNSTVVEYHRDTHRRPSGQAIKTSSRVFADDPFRARFGHKLPRGLAQEARGMEWRTFAATYAPTGNFRIQNLESDKLRAGKFRYTATMTERIGDKRTTEIREIIATGPISACTNLLADSGRRVEILEFHQFEIFEATATFLYVADNKKRAWVMGFGPTPAQSGAAAMSSAAYRLHG